MNKIVNRVLNILKYSLFIIMSIIILYGIINSYTKLGKNLIESLDLLFVFCLGLIFIIINIFSKNSKIKENMLYNIVAITAYIAIIIIGIRSNFDINMVSYYKNPVNYNLLYFNENILLIKIMAYLLILSNIILLFVSNKEQKKEIIEQL